MAAGVYQQHGENNGETSSGGSIVSKRGGARNINIISSQAKHHNGNQHSIMAFSVSSTMVAAVGRHGVSSSAK